MIDRLGSVFHEALLTLRLGITHWENRGEPCGLLDGADEPLGYDGIPNEFRAFMTWGVDGVHEGLWVDDPHQQHKPFVVMASPMDFNEPLILLASDVDDWLRRVELDRGRFGSGEAEEIAEKARARRDRLGLPPIR